MNLIMLNSLAFANIFTLCSNHPPNNSSSSVEDDCTDDWVWGECVPWNLDKATGCGTEGRQEAKREGTGCQIIAFQIKCIPECNKKGKSGDKNDNAGKQTPDQDRDEVDTFEDNGIGLWGVDNEPDEESNGKKGLILPPQILIFVRVRNNSYLLRDITISCKVRGFFNTSSKKLGI